VLGRSSKRWGWAIRASTGQVQPYSINHNVVRGKAAMGDCQACHSDDSSDGGADALAGRVPRRRAAKFVENVNVRPAVKSPTSAGALFYQPDLRGRWRLHLRSQPRHWLDWFGALIFRGRAAADRGARHAAPVTALRRPRQAVETEPVYMYDRYERFLALVAGHRSSCCSS
jgi:hypothetical protein